MGCTYGQGFYFAPPLTSDELDAYLAQGSGYAITERRRTARHDVRHLLTTHLWQLRHALMPAETCLSAHKSENGGG